ncbi:MAG: hypothetical protein GXP19_02730 [Gammaproteobacteria bacterium]|nr:hypothetical protein [Gammaproteobacteria bacterium]
MKHEDNIRQLKSEHDSIDALLPWYINGTLSPEEYSQVEKHMETCRQCRTAITELQSMQIVVQQSTDTALVERKNLQDVLSRIDQIPVESAARKHESRRKQHEPLTKKISDFWDVFMNLPGGWRYTVVAQFLLLVVVFGVTFDRPSMAPVFTTLSTPAEDAQDNSVRMRIVFAEDVLLRDIRHLLIDGQARIVDGPTSSGVYMLETVYRPSEVLQDVLDRWREKALVRFVEPVSNVE